MNTNIPGLKITDASNPRVTVYGLANGASFPLVTAPMDNVGLTSDGNHAAGFVGPVIKALVAFDTAVHKAKNDANLSEVGREDKAKGPREALQTALAEAETQLGQMSEAAEAMRAAALAPAPIATEDYNSGLIDNEIRGCLRSMSVDEVNSYLKTLNGNTRHLDAIARSPVPIPRITEYAARVRAEALENSPAMTRARSHAEAAEWGIGVTSTLKRII